MCGRIEVLFDRMKATLDNLFDIPLSIQTNLDLRPTDQITAITSSAETLSPHCSIKTVPALWGIQPAWSKKIIINAQAETVNEKATFASAFRQQRCIIPCSGWFEWRDEGQAKKQKYRFSHTANKPLFMAGILYPAQQSELQQLVTLTIAPNDKCAEYHHRMPLFIPSTEINPWLHQDAVQVKSLLTALPDKWINVSAA
ncbi:SOS response-associated peptidase [Shewanella donghaensis]|uniref:SOS response-associated peptidase n=1 Tax=Shewanella donghaensis TaxID=238836 RepID=UPI001183F96A|nr:SOS response-associated peptidase family protein [Shewanella donghaensis]